MQKLLTFVLIITILLCSAIVLLTQRYKTVTTTQGTVLVFDSLTCSFIEKNEKGEWEISDIKKGEAFMSFSDDGTNGDSSGKTLPSTKPKTKPAVKKPDLKI